LKRQDRTIDDFFSRARIANAQSGTETVLAQERRNDDYRTQTK